MSRKPSLSSGTKEALAAAERLMMSGDEPGTAELLRRIPQEDRGTPEVLSLHIRYCFMTGDMTRADKLLMQLQRTDPSAAQDVAWLQAESALRQKDGKRAEKIARQALAHYPGNGMIFAQIARAMAENGCADAGEQMLLDARATGLFPESEDEFLFRLAEMACQQGEAVKAIGYVTRLGEMNLHPVRRVMLGRELTQSIDTLAGTGDTENAIAMLEHVCYLSPMDPWLAEYHAMVRREQAMMTSFMALDQDLEVPDELVHLVDLATHQGQDIGLSEKEFEAAVFMLEYDLLTCGKDIAALVPYLREAHPDIQALHSGFFQRVEETSPDELLKQYEKKLHRMAGLADGAFWKLESSGFYPEPEEDTLFPGGLPVPPPEKKTTKRTPGSGVGNKVLQFRPRNSEDPG